MRTARQGLALLILLTFGSACTTDPYTGERQVSKTAIGAAVGAATGNSVATVLVEYDKTIIEVTGHTDNTGSDGYNQSLSERRASTIGSYLGGQGINHQRLISMGFGESIPIASNDTPAGREQNRRAELKLVPLTE